MSIPKITSQGCFLASNMIIYLSKTKKIRVSSRYEVPGRRCQHRMSFWEKYQDSIDLHWFALILHGFDAIWHGSWHFSQNETQCWQGRLDTPDQLQTRNFLILYHQIIIFEARKHPCAGISCLHIDSRSDFFSTGIIFSLDPWIMPPRFPGLAKCPPPLLRCENLKMWEG